MLRSHYWVRRDDSIALDIDGGGDDGSGGGVGGGVKCGLRAGGITTLRVRKLASSINTCYEAIARFQKLPVCATVCIKAFALKTDHRRAVFTSCASVGCLLLGAPLSLLGQSPSFRSLFTHRFPHLAVGSSHGSISIFISIRSV